MEERGWRREGGGERVEERDGGERVEERGGEERVGMGGEGVEERGWVWEERGGEGRKKEGEIKEERININFHVTTSNRVALRHCNVKILH